MLNFIYLPLFKNFTSNSNFFPFKKRFVFMQKSKKRVFSKFKKLKCCSEEIKNILLELPEAFVNDEKRHSLGSLPVLQRIGKLDLLTKKTKIQPLQKIDFSEINHEFRFLWANRKTNIPKNSIQITLGLNKEDNLLDSQGNFPIRKKYTSTLKNLQQKSKTQPKLNLKSYKLILSTTTFSKITLFQKIIFSIILILASYLSVF